MSDNKDSTPSVDFQSLAKQAFDELSAADARSDQADKALIGDLATDNWNAVVTPLGVACELLRHFPDKFLVVDGGGELSPRVLLKHEGGTWIDDDMIFRSLLDELGRQYINAMDRIVSRLNPNEPAGKAQRAIYRERTRLWRGASITHAKPAAKFELEVRFGDGIQTLPEDAKLPTMCVEGDLAARMDWLGAPNGVVNLHTGRHISDPSEAQKRLVVGMLPDPFDWEAESELAERLFSHLDAEVRQYLLASIAWALRGNPSRVFLLLLGPGGGGKSTLSIALQSALGLYSSTVSEDAFTRRRNNSSGLSPSIRNLIAPKRLAFMPEANKALYDAERLKSISGADRVTWRPLYRPERTDTVTATVVMSANHLPNLDGTDEALMSRMRVLPYDSIPEKERDARMIGAFVGNSPEAVRARQALITMVIKAGMGLSDKPVIPPAVKKATDDAMSDLIGEAGIWVQANVERAGASVLSTASLWKAVCEAFNASVSDKVVGGLSRRGVVKLVSSRFGKTEKIRDPQLGGKVARGWKQVGLKG